MPSSRPRGSSSGSHQSQRVSTAPMSERQQMALVMQLTSQTNQQETSTHRTSHSGKSRDDKKGGTGDDTSSSITHTATMDSVNKNVDAKNDKESSANSDKHLDEAVVSTSTPNVKRALPDVSDVLETETVEDEGTKRKKRKDSDSNKESSKSSQSTKSGTGRNSVSGSKPPGPASKTGVAPLSKGSGLLGSGKSGNSNSQGKSGSGSHGQGQGKNSGNANSKGNVSGGQASSQSGKGSGNQGKSQSSGLSVSQGSKGLTDKKSPCASPKPSTYSQLKDDSEVDENKAIETGGPKVPPLKIVIPGGVGGSGGSGSQQEGEGGSTQRGSTKSRGGNSTLPYILQPSSSADSMSSNSDGNDCNSENTKEDKRVSSNSLDEKTGLSGQRVLRSHRNADGAEKDKERGRNSPHVSQSSLSGGGSQSKTPHHLIKQENDGASTSGSGGGSGSGQSSSGNSQIVWDGVFQVPSVDFHPRKRKIKSSKESHSHHQSAPDSSSHSSGSAETHINLQSNSYQMHINLKKQIERRLKALFPVQPKPPQGFKDYLMNRCTYVLESNSKQQPILKPPLTLPPQMREEFINQENERHYLRVQHLVEKEKLVLAVEQEILRVHGRAARALANQVNALPFSVCSVLKDKEVYNMLTPEQEEKERNAQRSRYNGRLFLSWLQDVDDKWEKIKESMVKRHHIEAESLYAAQSMSWSWRLEELGLCDHKTALHVDPGHVPRVNVSDDFDLLPA